MIASVAASLVMALISVPFNYFVIYPLYYNVLGFPQAAVLQMYQIILPKTKSILQALLIFNLPFTFVKGLIVSIITMVIYKPLSPILKGKNNKANNVRPLRIKKVRKIRTFFIICFVLC